jgi:hypothetical protein
MEDLILQRMRTHRATPILLATAAGTGAPRGAEPFHLRQWFAHATRFRTGSTT